MNVLNSPPVPVYTNTSPPNHLYAMALVFSFVKKPERAAVPVAPCCDLLKVCEVVTVCILSQSTAYSISAVFADIPL